MSVVNAEWELSYDTSKLSLVSYEKDFMPNVSDEIVNVANGVVYGNASNAYDPYNFSGGKTFVRAYFDIIDSGYTTVDLKVKTLGVGYMDENTHLPLFETIVKNSVIKDITGVQGFENLKYYTDTTVTASIVGYEYGDVDLDGTISVDDATYLQMALAKLISIDANQKSLGDVNFDGEINIDDVTRIQLYIAKSIDSFT